MTNNVQDILKKISYIETDIEIQKQILFSIPSKEKPEMEKVLKIIAGLKNQVETLRLKIKEIDPDAHSNILMFENAVAEFKRLAKDKEYKSITTWQPDTPCSLTLQSGETIECLIKAADGYGNFTVITFDGNTREFLKNEITG